MLMQPFKALIKTYLKPYLRSFITTLLVNAGTGPKRKLGAWHLFKIRNNRPAKKSIDYLFKITQCLEVFSTLLPAVALEQYSSEKAKQALVGINDKFANRNYTRITEHAQVRANK